MKKYIPLIIAGVVAVGALATYQLTKKGNPLVQNTEVKTSTKSNGGSYKTIKACDVFTQAVADAVLGAGAKKSDISTGETASDDITVSTCSYSQSSSMKTTTLLSRSAKTADGATSNKSQFTTGLPSVAVSVDGIGEDAYWDPTYGQLNILVHNNWYILTSGGLRPADKSQEEAKTFAKLILPKL